MAESKTVKFQGRQHIGYKAADGETYSGDKETGVVEVPAPLAANFVQRHGLKKVGEPRANDEAPE